MLVRSLFALGLASALFLAGGEAQAAKGKKGEHMIHGVIESVTHDKEHGTLVVKIHHHKKKGSPGAGTEKTVHFGKHTRIEIAKGGKEHAGHLHDLRKGEHVGILEKGSHAERIVIHEGHRKGKK